MYMIKIKVEIKCEVQQLSEKSLPALIKNNHRSASISNGNTADFCFNR